MMTVISGPRQPTHVLGGTRFTSLATPSRGSIETSVWRADIAAGTEATPHRVTREEVFVVLAGRASVLVGGVESIAAAGDAIVVPPDTDFVLSNAGDADLQMLCCLPVGGQAVTSAGAFTPPWAQ